MVSRRTLLRGSALAAGAVGGLTAVGAATATARETAETAAAQTIYRTASGVTHLAGALGDEVDRAFGPGRIRLASSAIVVQTGIAPWNGPGMPVSQLTGTTDADGFRFRLFDQGGAAITEARAGLGTHVFFHAAVRTADGVHAADLASVQTDANGWATVRFRRPLRQAPVSVVATGSSPYRGPGLPLNLVTTGHARTGFRVRALDQQGAPIASQRIRLHYWATVQPVTPNTRAGTVVVTPNAQGAVNIPYQEFVTGAAPQSVILTSVAPHGGPDMPVNLMAFTPAHEFVSVRALNQTGEPITTPIRVAFYATRSLVS